MVPSARAPLMATLGNASGQPNFVATVNANGTSITVVPAALLTNDPRAIELWIIQPGGRPRSLGLVQPGQPIRLVIPPELVGKITPESTLAVSLEPLGRLADRTAHRAGDRQRQAHGSVSRRICVFRAPVPDVAARW